ncbi:hypothetical protein HGRIS_005185 [Hohenbuehelia grisea]|uniref:Transmembrane protein n=1 Tax=Hohenbuehelia grisea TaxID=104357 RepID=A0ABR3JE82_9AGAR
MSKTVIVDEMDPSVVCEGDWVKLTLSPQFNESSSGSLLPGAKCTLNFTGTSIMVVTTILKGKPFSLEFELDGITTTNSSIGLNDVASDVYSFHDATFSQSNLSDGEHKLVVTYAQAPEPIGIYLDYFMYTASSRTNLSGVNLFIDDRDPSIMYSGDWRSDTADAQFRHTADNTSFSSLAVTFEGIGIQLFGLDPEIGSPDPLAFVYKIDSSTREFVAQPTSVSSTLEWYNWLIIDSGQLSPGVHTFTVTPRSKHPFWIDYILVNQPITSAMQTTAPGSASSIVLSSLPPSAITSTTSISSVAPANSATSNSGFHSFAGVIAGATVAGVLTLALIALSFVLLRMRRRQRAVAEPRINLAEERPYTYSSLALPLDSLRTTTVIQPSPGASTVHLPDSAQSFAWMNVEPFSASRPDLTVANPTDDDAVSSIQRGGSEKGQLPSVMGRLSCNGLGLVTPSILSPTSYTDAEASGRACNDGEAGVVRRSDVEAWVDDLPPSYVVAER